MRCAACRGLQAEGQPCAECAEIERAGRLETKRQLTNFKDGARVREKDVFGKMMAPMAATLADEAAIDNVVAYIRTLPDTPAPTTLQKNAAANGQKLYETCAACHGADGQGIQATNAPRLKGMSDWYMVTQLKNFKHGIRGAHPKDLYGPQMALMGAILADDQATDDLVAYIDTLR